MPGKDIRLFLPMNAEHMAARGWSELDVLLVSGDAYVDHPSFGIALLGRHLEAHGYRVGIVAQPRWDTIDDIACMGRPRLFAGVSAGAVDSMLAHYTAFRKKRSDDAYTPGGKAGARPNRAVSVYTNLVRRAFPGLPVVAGGIEASLRRISHFDFWQDALRKSLLPDAKLDLIIYGMGEHAILEVARRAEHAARHKTTPDLASIPGTATLGQAPANAVLLPSHQEILDDPFLLVHATRALEQQVHKASQVLAQKVDTRFVIVQPPAPVLSTEELDALYALPYTRLPHPEYTQPIPCAPMMLTSITSHRGCGGGCSFCSLALHQGRRIASRSQESLLAEANALLSQTWFKGVVSDVGGPTANMWQGTCALGPERCARASCFFPSLCQGFTVDQSRHIALLRAIRSLPGMKHVRVASGIRFDLAIRNPEALTAYTGEFTGGQLKVAPEHICPEVLRLMRKPGLPAFQAFLDSFYSQCHAQNKEQYVIPYLMSAFPGCTNAHMAELANWLKQRHWKPQQVQCFIPTPGTMATAMFYSGRSPQGETIFVARTDAQRLQQHALLVPRH